MSLSHNEVILFWNHIWFLFQFFAFKKYSLLFYSNGRTECLKENIVEFMFGSCHLDRASNVEIGVECQIFVIVIFFNCSRVLQFGAHSRYYKGALTQKRSFLGICTTFRYDFYVGWKNQNKHSSLNSSFDTMSKWHLNSSRIL